ncbi:MAG: 30S ribosomal protein S20 [Clostridia bacterium]|nr:30S ribosomal protein S20 [Clostridia bacterium]
MPNIKSAKKRVMVTAVRTARNKAYNSALKTAIKKASAAIDTSAADKEQVVRLAVKKIDQAAAKGIIHKNTAVHKKSALALKLKANA